MTEVPVYRGNLGDDIDRVAKIFNGLGITCELDIYLPVSNRSHIRRELAVHCSKITTSQIHEALKIAKDAPLDLAVGFSIITGEPPQTENRDEESEYQWVASVISYRESPDVSTLPPVHEDEHQPQAPAASLEQ